MTAYIINDAVTEDELLVLNQQAPANTAIARWPTLDATLPRDIDVAILIIRETSTSLEEARAVAAVNAGVRIVCVHLDEVKNISEIAQKYCSARVAVGGAFGDALTGNDHIQETYDGKKAPRNKQKPHNC